MTEQSPENKKSKRKAPHPLFRLLDFAGPYKILTVVGCALSGLHSLLAVMPLVCVWFIMSQFVAVAPQWSEASGAAFYAWLAVGFAVAGVVVYFAALMCTHIAAFRTGNNMRKAATHHLSKVPLGYYDEHSTGELRRVIDGCAGQTESVLAHKFPDFVGALITPVVFVVVMFIFDWAMGLACLVPIAVSFACIWRMMGGGGSDENSSYLTFVSNYQQALNRMNAAATEYVRGMPVVKSVPANGRFVQRIQGGHPAVPGYGPWLFEVVRKTAGRADRGDQLDLCCAGSRQHPACGGSRGLRVVLHGLPLLRGVQRGDDIDDDQDTVRL